MMMMTTKQVSLPLMEIRLKRNQRESVTSVAESDNTRAIAGTIQTMKETFQNGTQ